MNIHFIELRIIQTDLIPWKKYIPCVYCVIKCLIEIHFDIQFSFPVIIDNNHISNIYYILIDEIEK
jgi:hypothetical protein